MKLIVFDLDGTIVAEPEFYRKVYSATLNLVVESRRGKRGLQILEHCREKFDGKGELALLALNIPFREWAQYLTEAPLDLIVPQPTLVKQMRKLSAHKVIYTGSPTRMAQRMLARLGFSREDFDEIIGWDESELFPMKWTCSPLVFKMILTKFSVAPSEVWSVGDDWETDLKPAKIIGMKTAEIRNYKGEPTQQFNRLEDFLVYYLNLF